MTREEIESSRLFQIAERLLKGEFPFIKWLRVAPDFAKYESVVFLDAYINLDEMAEMYEFTYPSWRNMDIHILYLYHIPMLPSVELKNTLTELQKEIEETIKSLGYSAHIPLEYREILRRQEGEDRPYNFKSFFISKFIPVT